VVVETLRLDPPIRISVAQDIDRSIEMRGFRFLQGQKFTINISYLHRNPEQWQRPLEFLPDRFDHLSPLYLTPSGKKRHPMSFGPFLGGRRICIGKTFAENMAKCILAVLYGSVRFEFADP
jgi:cytochrome P450